MRSASRSDALPPSLPVSRLSVEGIDLSLGIAGRPDLCCIALVTHGEVKLLEAMPIYPTGWGGHFALGSPDGAVLFPGTHLQIELAGLRIVGVIARRSQADYFVAPDGSPCGLVAGMRVVMLGPGREEVEARP